MCMHMPLCEHLLECSVQRKKKQQKKHTHTQNKSADNTKTTAKLWNIHIQINI